MDTKRISKNISIFHGYATEQGNLVGYGALIHSLGLAVPTPRTQAFISKKHRKYETANWLVFTPRHQPKETIYSHLVFALKYEGVNLLFFKKIFEKLPANLIEEWINNEPQSQYARKIWFLFEWLMQRSLQVPDLKEGNYVNLIDKRLQYANTTSYNSGRHRIKNNLPGNFDFCPLIYKTAKLEKYIAADLSGITKAVVSGLRKDILHRTSAFLLLKDSKASFTIEGENPGQNRAIRWGRAIGQAGNEPLTREGLLRLQQIIIESSRFMQMGYRTEGGFVGEHDRATGEPIPEHISARWQDLDKLMNGLITTASQLAGSEYDPVLTAAGIAFGFVFIHPFVDGNGRLHRYLIHHLLAVMKFTPQGIIFPVSASILERINDYRNVLESYSNPLLDFIEWKKTKKNNIDVLNETIDYYRYFDATAIAEFLFDSIDYTIKKIIPQEVAYLQKYDAMRTWIDDVFQMPDKAVALLIRFLEQSNGTFSKKAREREFPAITDSEAKEIEEHFKMFFEISDLK